MHRWQIFSNRFLIHKFIRQSHDIKIISLSHIDCASCLGRSVIESPCCQCCNGICRINVAMFDFILFINAAAACC